MKSLTVAEEIIAAHSLRRRIQSDSARPGYHFCIPFDLGFPGDPNAVFYAFGKYHYMFIYQNREDSYRWGHAISADLVHWQFLPDALLPDETDGGIYSGGVYLTETGKAVVTYWALGKEGSSDGIRIAESEPPFYDKWEKREGYIVKNTKLGIADILDGGGNPIRIASADPSNIWKSRGKYYLQLGNLGYMDALRSGWNEQAPGGDFTELLVSDDLKEWRYVHRFYKRDDSNRWTDGTEDSMCPYFGELPFGKHGGKGSGKYLQLFLAHNRGAQYYIGNYDERKQIFIPEKHGRMSFADRCLFAPEATTAPDGRLISFFWHIDKLGCDVDRDLKNGWYGVHALPRELWLNEHGSLGIAPIREIRKQRINKQKIKVGKKNGEETECRVLNPDSCELVLETEKKKSGETGFKIYLNGGKDEFIRVCVDFDMNKLILDTSQSGSSGCRICDEAPFEVKGNRLILNVFIDKCIIEVFANDLQAMSRQVFDSIPGRRQVYVFGCEGKAEITAYEIMPANML